MKKRWCLLALFLLLACSQNVGQNSGLSSFAVTVVEGDIGSADNRIAFPEEPVRYVLDIEARDAEGKRVRSLNRNVAISVQPVGRLATGQTSRIAVTDGRADGVEIWIERCHGDVTIWVEDAGGLDEAGTFAAGASPVLHFAHPTIAQVQRTDDIENSPLSGDFIEINLTERRAVVTNIKRDGFYCQDIDETGGAYAGIYVYTHNSPDDVVEGSYLTALRGEAEEYFGFTELSFPDYLVGDGELALPDPVLIDATLLADENAMEALESSLVEVQGVVVCPMDEQYEQYDQWKVLVDPSATCDDTIGAILVAETGGIEGLDPPSLTGQTLDHVIGTLRYHYLAEPSWMIVPRRASDVE